MKRRIKTDIDDEKVSTSLDVLEDMLKHPDRYEHIPDRSEIHPITVGVEAIAVTRQKR